MNGAIGRPMRGGLCPPARAAMANTSRNGKILAAEYVFFINPPTFQRQSVAFRHVVNVHDIQAGIDKRRHAPGRGVANHFAGGGRLDVARSDRRGRFTMTAGTPCSRTRSSTACSAGISTVCRR